MKKIILTLLLGILVVGIITGVSLKNYEYKEDLKEISSKKLCEQEEIKNKTKKHCTNTKDKKIKLKDYDFVIQVLGHNETGGVIYKID